MKFFKRIKHAVTHCNDLCEVEDEIPVRGPDIHELPGVVAPYIEQGSVTISSRIPLPSRNYPINQESDLDSSDSSDDEKEEGCTNREGVSLLRNCC